MKIRLNELKRLIKEAALEKEVAPATGQPLERAIKREALPANPNFLASLRVQNKIGNFVLDLMEDIAKDLNIQDPNKCGPFEQAKYNDAYEQLTEVFREAVNQAIKTHLQSLPKIDKE